MRLPPERLARQRTALHPVSDTSHVLHLDTTSHRPCRISVGASIQSLNPQPAAAVSSGACRRLCHCGHPHREVGRTSGARRFVYGDARQLSFMSAAVFRVALTIPGWLACAPYFPVAERAMVAPSPARLVS